MEMAGINWSDMYARRREIHARWPAIWNVPLAKKSFDLIACGMKDAESLLDIGAFERGLESKLKERFPDLRYKSMDTDRGRSHDYYSLDDVRERFDVVVLSEVIEHLALGEGIALMRRAGELLDPSGRMILTTPNTFMPSRFLSDPTHKTAWAYDELGAVLMCLGFRVASIHRMYNDAFFRRLARRTILAPLHRWISVDFARSIAIVVGKN